MPQRILFECFNLALTSGTGIKTYASNLARIAKTLGYETEALFQSLARLQQGDPILTEISFLEGKKRRGWKERYVRTPFETLFGKPFGIRADAVPQSGFILGQEPLLEPFARVFAAHQFTLAARRHFSRYGTLATLKLESAPNLFHATHPVPVRVPRAANVYTIHDLVPLRLPNATLDNKKYYFNVIKEICQKADHIITISEASKKDIISLIGTAESKISVTYQSVDIPEVLANKSDIQIEKLLRNVFSLGRGEYFLFYGALEPKKNVSRLIDAYVASGVSTPLIIAGGLGWNYRTELRQINSENFSTWRIVENQIIHERKVRRLGHLPPGQLTTLIQGAKAVLFPSLYEGFGLPVLEAMTLGVPVMTSNISSLPEVAGEAALLVDPYDLEDMASAITALDSDQDLRSDLINKGKERARHFSAENYSKRVAEVYTALL